MKDIIHIPESDGLPAGLAINLSYIRNQLKEHSNYNVEQLMQLAMEQNIVIGQSKPKKEFFINYTLKDLTAMSFEQWARLIEIENITNNA